MKHDVMLAKKFEERKAVWPMWGSLKLDGIRGQHKSAMVSRNGKPIRGMSHIEKVLGTLVHPMDGELMVLDKHFQVSSGLIRSYSETPEAHYFIFDIVHPELKFEERQELLKLMVKEINHPQIHVVEHVLLHNLDEAMDFYVKALRDGFEGAMLKSREHMYRNARSWDWMKMKVTETADLQCVGFFEGEGRLTGTLGGIIVDYNGVHVRVGSGFNDAVRDIVWNDKDCYLNGIAEIAWHEETPDGSLRHPRFLRWRDDL